MQPLNRSKQIIVLVCLAGLSIIPLGLTCAETKFTVGPRFFFFLDPTFSNWRYRDYNLTRNLEDIRSLGGTDVIILDSQKGTLFWNSSIPNAIYDKTLKEKDFLSTLLPIAERLGLRVWIGLHPICGHGRLDERVMKINHLFFARDRNGRIYGKPHPTYDVFSPQLRKFWFTVIEEIANKYNRSGVIQGFFWDEIWFNQSDLFGDDADKFTTFSLQHFGSKPDETIVERFKTGYYATFRGEDLWWRRTVLFRQHGHMEFLNILASHARKKGFANIIRPWNSSYMNKGWIRMGVAHELIEIAKKGDFTWTSRTGPYGTDIYANGIVGIYPRRSKHTWGQMCSRALKGLPNCVFLYDWVPFQEGKLQSNLASQFLGDMVPDLRPRLRDFIKISRDWYDSHSAATWAVLNYQRGMTLRFDNPERMYETNEARLYKTLSRITSVDMNHVEDVSIFDRHPLVVAPEHTLQYLSPTVLQNLLEYVAEGGFLVNFSPLWSTAEADLSNNESVGEEILGIKTGGLSKRKKYLITFLDTSFIVPGRSFAIITSQRKDEIVSENSTVLASFEDGSPAVSLTHWGKGSIINFHFNLPESLGLKTTQELLTEVLVNLAPPPVIAGGDLEVGSVLTKDRKVLIALHNNSPHYDLKTKLVVNPEKLGLVGEVFKMRHLLAAKQGDQLAKISRDELMRGLEIVVSAEKQYEVVTIEACALETSD
jgi:hypothetical protein